VHPLAKRVNNHDYAIKTTTSFVEYREIYGLDQVVWQYGVLLSAYEKSFHKFTF